MIITIAIAYCLVILLYPILLVYYEQTNDKLDYILRVNESIQNVTIMLSV